MNRVAVCALVSGFSLCLHAHGQSGTITTVAGSSGLPRGVIVALNAPLGTLTGIAVDSQGNIYVADTDNDQVFQVTPTGGIQVVAGNGLFYFSGDGGSATSASLNGPKGIAVDASGNLFILDAGNYAIRKVSTDGNITTMNIGTAGLSGNFGVPFLSGIALDATGNLFIAGSNQVWQVSVDGIVTVVAGSGIPSGGFSGDGGLATSALLNGPMGIAVDTSGNLFIADSGNNRVRKVSASGVISTFAGNGTAGYSGDGGPATLASLSRPSGVTADVFGNLFIVDGNNVIRKVSSDGVIRTVAGNGTAGFSGDGGTATAALLSMPNGAAVDAFGNLFIADGGNHRVREVSASGTITTIAGGEPAGGLGDGGPATSASLGQPDGVAIDDSGNLFIADTENSRIRKVSATGIVTTVAGDGDFGFSGDGGPATAASLGGPWGIAVDANGNLFIADTYNNLIREVSVNGTITTVAGGGDLGDGAPATSVALSQPFGVAVDGYGNLFIADTNAFLIRKVSADGIITTVAGGGNPPDGVGDGGPATAAALRFPCAVALDNVGNFYIADSLNHRIRKVSADGIITTVAGGGNPPDGVGDGGPATSASVGATGVAVDGSSNLFIVDGSRLREVSAATGIITTIAGNGKSGFSGDGGPATLASLNPASNYCSGLALDSSGNLFMADSYNNRIREVFSVASPTP